MLNNKKHKGYLMIEILITLLIFSVAIITLTALETKSNTGVSASNYREMAINYSQDLFDKMRANKAAVVAGTYLGSTMANNGCKSFNYNAVNSVANCSTTLMAQDDLFEFNAVVTATLPSSAWTLCIDSSNAQGTPTTPNCDGVGNNYVIKIFWKDKIGEAINNNSGYSQVIVSTQI